MGAGASVPSGGSGRGARGGGRAASDASPAPPSDVASAAREESDDEQDEGVRAGAKQRGLLPAPEAERSRSRAEESAAEEKRGGDGASPKLRALVPPHMAAQQRRQPLEIDFKDETERRAVALLHSYCKAFLWRKAVLERGGALCDVAAGCPWPVREDVSAAEANFFPGVDHAAALRPVAALSPPLPLTSAAFSASFSSVSPRHRPRYAARSGDGAGAAAAGWASFGSIGGAPMSSPRGRGGREVLIPLTPDAAPTEGVIDAE